jgi:DNA helicase-2/ATP-dependent DNA helicase PcrA
MSDTTAVAGADLFAGLNDAQRRAVEATEGPLLLIAGPGSGKTRVITHRIAHLVANLHVHPYRILAVTFTNKAAREMRERAEGLLGETAHDLALGTFHAICARLLRVEGLAVGLERGFTIFDDADQLGVVKRALADLDLGEKRNPPRAILSVISRAKNEMRSPERFAAEVRSYPEEIVARVFRRYQEILESNSAVDFDDLLLKAVELFARVPDVRHKYADRYRYVMIDEFQDTNPPQYELAKQLASVHGNICVVGDPDQSIYSWRAASVENILNFERDFPGTRVIRLEENYRSTQTILDSAMGVIGENPRAYEMKLSTAKGAGTPVVLYEAEDDEDEAYFAARVIKEDVDAGKHRLGDFAVMYRTNAMSRPYEDAFTRLRIRYRLIGGTRFYERKEVKDLIAYLRVIHNPLDSVSLDRIINVPGRGLGTKTLEEVRRWAAELNLPLFSALQVLAAQERGMPDAPGPRHRLTPRATGPLLAFHDLLAGLIDLSRVTFVPVLVDEVLERTGYEEYLQKEYPNADERIENVRALRGQAIRYSDLQPDAGLGEFLADVTLVSDVDEMDDQLDAVTLITLHAAKGLEFPVVFIAGMEQGVLPHQRSFDDRKQGEEERRLAYVGMTRAKDQLYLTRAFRRMLFGSTAHNPASRFLRAIPAHLVQQAERATAPAAARPAVTTRRYTQDEPPRPRPNFADGDRVRHAKFGEGVVVTTRESGADLELTIAFNEAGIKRLLLSFAALEKLG